MYNALTISFGKFSLMLESNDYSGFDQITQLRDLMTDLYVKLTKRQIKRVKENETTTRGYSVPESYQRVENHCPSIE